MINHTQGPWRVSFESRAIVGGSPSMTIARIDGELSDRIGNARVISAVPPMLQALNSIMNASSDPGAREMAREALRVAGL